MRTFFILFLLSIYSAIAGNDGLATKKIANPPSDALSPGEGFQASVFNKPFIARQLPYIPFLAEIPQIDHYGGLYKFWRRALIETDPKQVFPLIPKTMQDELLYKQGFNIRKALAQNDIKTYVSIISSPFLLTTTPWDGTYRLIEHPVLSVWEPAHQENLNRNIPMGIFDADGLVELAKRYKPVPFDRFEPISVITHPSSSGTALSPNNARFAADPKRSIATGWSAAISPDNTKAVIAYHIFIINPEIDKGVWKARTLLIPGVSQLVEQAETIGDLVEGLRKLPAVFPKIIGKKDSQALARSTDLVTAMVKRQPPLGKDPQQLIQDMNLLINRLNTLATVL